MNKVVSQVGQSPQFFSQSFRDNLIFSCFDDAVYISVAWQSLDLGRDMLAGVGNGFNGLNQQVS
jgi:hypothetical protein